MAGTGCCTGSTTATSTSTTSARSARRSASSTASRTTSASTRRSTRGHPPGFVLILWSLDQIGLGGARWAAALCIAGGAVAVVAVLTATRDVAGDRVARSAMPFVAIAPIALWIGTERGRVLLRIRRRVGCARDPGRLPTGTGVRSRSSAGSPSACSCSARTVSPCWRSSPSHWRGRRVGWPHWSLPAWVPPPPWDSRTRRASTIWPGCWRCAASTSRVWRACARTRTPSWLISSCSP